LFFLSTGIFFGFKKPVVFFGFDTIESISYTSVLQRTFNLNIAARTADDEDADEAVVEFEFSMIDQAEYAGIDAYVKRHGLQDASLAEARRAKKLNVKGEKRRAAEGGGDDGDADGAEGEDDGETELQKAQRELEDREDEAEEDYDPGSDGGSDGSGTSSDEEEADGDGGGADDEDDEGRDLVAEELGSEAEEVSVEEE
jgi:hypothetical protein